MQKYIRWFDEISIADVPIVGGKNASLGEMYRTLGKKGIRVPPGFAITADAFSALIQQDEVGRRVYSELSRVDTHDTEQLAKAGNKVREWVRAAGIPQEVRVEIHAAYAKLCSQVGVENLDVAVRSSATAEDLPDASFAGQQETFLNIRGEDQLLTACLNCFASLFTDRAISYRTNKGFEHDKVRLSVCVQQMVRSDLSSSGVIFTLDTESGARNVILLTSAYGLGENVVAGRVDPDEFLISKPLLGKAPNPILRKKLGSKQLKMVYSGHGSRTTKNLEVSEVEREAFSISDSDAVRLCEWAATIESYYSELNRRDTPMDIEWGKDGRTGELFILQ
ncbi:MAG: phosphoenolpyruvate synthase, partial [Bdellovibrionaceae bacterium]|nr:phosphoenolpyruvate synthase [Pseudobdellovibrionaceae bacterium]